MQVGKNEHNHFRGLHIVVFNVFMGIVDLAIVFDTYKTSDQLDDFIMSDIPDGSIIIAACMDECFTHMSDEAK